MEEQSVDPDRPVTADQLRAALRALDGLESRPVEEHVAAYDVVHAALQTALREASSEPGTGRVAGAAAESIDTNRPPSSG